MWSTHAVRVTVVALAVATMTMTLTPSASAQSGYTPYGNGPVVVVPSATPGLPYGAGPGYGYGGAAVLPYGNGSGVVVTPGTAVPYGRYNKDAAREAFQINNALGGAQAANDAAARTQAPLTPLNPMPGGLR